MAKRNILYSFLVVAFSLTFSIQIAIAGSKPNIAVLDFESIGSEEHIGKAVAEIMRTELVGTNKFRVVERSQIQKALEEQKLQMTGLIDEESVKEIGKLIGADFIIVGSVVKIGNSFTINSRMIDVKTGEAKLGRSVTGGDVNLLTNLSRDLIGRLFGKKDDWPQEETSAIMSSTDYQKTRKQFSKDLKKMSIKKGLIAYYPFDSNLKDESGNENNGSLHGNPTFVKGIFGSALNFDGIDDIVIVDKKRSLDITREITMMAWVYPMSYGDHSTIMTDWNYYLQIHSDGKIATYFYGFSNPGYHFSNSTVPLNTWSHIAIVWKSNEIKIYLNGKVDRSFPNSGFGKISFRKPFSIGYQADFNRAFHGAIDEVRIYNRFLIESEISGICGIAFYRTTKKHAGRNTQRRKILSNRSLMTSNAVTDGQLLKQDNWRWDRKSQNLIFAGNPGAISPAGGTPDLSGSVNYVLYYVPSGKVYSGKGQDNWRWDRKSQNLIFAGNPGAISPAGGVPDFSGSANYILYPTNYGIPIVSLKKYQTGWKWDRKSQNLIFSNNPGAISPAGGEPDFSGSADYAVEYK